MGYIYFTVIKESLRCGGFDMVLLGLSSKEEWGKIENDLDSFGVFTLDFEFIQNDFLFKEITTKNLKERRLCCLGDMTQLKANMMRLQKYQNIPHIYALIKKSNESIIADANEWLTFICHCLSKVTHIALYRYYNDVPDVNNGVVKILLDNLTSDGLLKLDINQILIISRCL